MSQHATTLNLDQCWSSSQNTTTPTMKHRTFKNWHSWICTIFPQIVSQLSHTPTAFPYAILVNSRKFHWKTWRPHYGDLSQTACHSSVSEQRPLWLTYMRPCVHTWHVVHIHREGILVSIMFFVNFLLPCVPAWHAVTDIFCWIHFLESLASFREKCLARRT